MKKKIALGIITFLLLSSMIFAGGNNQQAKPGSEKVTLKYAFWGSPEAIGVEADIIAAFEAKYPNIKVEPVVSGYNDYHTKLLTMIAGGSAPDVMRISSQYLPDLVDSKGLMNIDQVAKAHNYDLSVFYKEGLTDCSWDGICYGLPWGTAPVYMLMNTTMFEEAGIPLPSYDWTFDDFIRIVKALTSGTGADKKYGFGMEIQTDLYPMYPYIWADGGNLVDTGKNNFALDKPEAYGAIQKIADLYQGGYMPPETLMTGTQTASVPSWFINNKLAMFQGTAANVLMIQNSGIKFEVWPLPSSSKTTHTTVVKSNATSISTKSPHPEEAWLFATFARGDEGESLYMKAKRVPPSISNEKYWDLYVDPNLYPKNIKEVTNLIFEKYGNLAPVRKGYLELEQLITPLCQNIMLGRTTAERAMKDISPRAQSILNK
ncbi:ABC transporter substrate-binding protein [Spirochaetia bacterium]|nr:ABC transporter substrate-binding protein [Spirochaetia bacterium]